jgi:SAM-dependent methyltransferase
VKDRSGSVRPGNYAEQARTYDYTRGASPTIVRALAKCLGEPPSRVLDIAGGTGNYAQVLQARGFDVVVVDASLEMLRHAAGKLTPNRVVAGNAELLPFRDHAFDRAIMVNAAHLIDDLKASFAEARRILIEGPFVLSAFVLENLGHLFVHEYFGLPGVPRPSVDEFVALLTAAGFGKVEHEHFVYTDTVDGSLEALHTDAMRLAGPAYLRNTSFWYAIDERTRQAGLEALARDLKSRVLEERVRESFKVAARNGHGTVFAAWP